MSFLTGFYTFQVNLTNADHGVEAKIRLKVPKHEQEPIPLFLGRILAFCHAYRPGFDLNKSYQGGDTPIFSLEPVPGIQVRLGYLGKVNPTTLRREVKNSSEVQVSIYLSSHEDILFYCQALRGSKTNWIKPLSFYRLPSELLEDLEEQLSSKNTWELTIIDDSTLYLEIGELFFSAEITPIDMWAQFQKSLRRVEAEVE